MEPQRARVALVSGGSRGIGVAIVRSLARAGYRVALGYRERESEAHAVSRGAGTIFPFRMELGDPASVTLALARVREELGAPEILVNNAGMAQEKPFESLSDADWEGMLSVNLLGAVRCIREVLPSMRAAGFGRIVNISSIGGQWGGVNQVHYAAAKAALINLTRSLARLYSAQGITTNAIAPGLCATDMSAAELHTAAGREKVAGIPAGRLGSVEEVAAAVRYLVSEQAGYVTGQTLNLNGGMYFG